MKEKMWIAAVSLALLLTGGAFSAAAESGAVAVAPDKAADGLSVTENGVSWTQMDYLNIFNNPAYNGEKIVVPGQSGQYVFTVENHTAYILDYDVAVSEVNRWELPMVCRLRSEKGYTGGEEWGSPETLGRPAPANCRRAERKHIRSNGSGSPCRMNRTRCWEWERMFSIPFAWISPPSRTVPPLPRAARSRLFWPP